MKHFIVWLEVETLTINWNDQQYTLLCEVQCSDLLLSYPLFWSIGPIPVLIYTRHTLLGWGVFFCLT